MKEELIGLEHMVFMDFVKKVPKNFRGVGVTFAATLNDTEGLIVKQGKEEHIFYFDDIKPWRSYGDLHTLEKRMMNKL